MQDVKLELNICQRGLRFLLMQNWYFLLQLHMKRLMKAFFLVITGCGLLSYVKDSSTKQSNCNVWHFWQLIGCIAGKNRIQFYFLYWAEATTRMSNRSELLDEELQEAHLQLLNFSYSFDCDLLFGNPGSVAAWTIVHRMKGKWPIIVRSLHKNNHVAASLEFLDLQ